jgi:ribosomal protein L5
MREKGPGASHYRTLRIRKSSNIASVITLRDRQMSSKSLHSQNMTIFPHVKETRISATNLAMAHSA